MTDDPFRDDDSMRCDCGATPVIMEVYWRGTDRERRICHNCTPEALRIEVRAVDPDNPELSFAFTKNLATRWGADQEHALEVFRGWMAAQNGETVILNDPEPERPKGFFARLWARVSDAPEPS